MRNTLFILSLLLPGIVEASKLYKWKDEKGVVHYSDRLPPDPDNAHQQLNEHGHLVDAVPRALTPEEKAAAAEELRQAKLLRQQRAEQEARIRQRDRILLQTFTTERDLLLARDDRLNAIDSSINLAVSNNARLQERMTTLQARIERLQAQNKTVSENLLKQMAIYQAQTEKNQKFITLKQEQRQVLQQQFDADLARYRELKGIPIPADEVELAAEHNTDASSP